MSFGAPARHFVRRHNAYAEATSNDGGSYARLQSDCGQAIVLLVVRG